MRVLLIGLDGGTWRVLEPAMRSGKMPALERIVRTGARAILRSTAPPITPAAWATMQTGMNPGQHGIFSFARWDGHTHARTLINGSFLPKTLWEYASDAGKSVGVVNVPMTYPPRPINGHVISGLDTPSVASDFTHPARLAPELLAQVPDYAILDPIAVRADYAQDNFEQFVGLMANAVRSRVAAASYLLQNHAYDLFMAHFQAVDVLQHPLWCYLDPDHLLYDRARHDYILRTFFSVLDEGIGAIHDLFRRQEAKDPVVTMVLSDHGFQSHIKRVNLANWLCHQGLLKYAEPAVGLIRLERWGAAVRKLDFLRLRHKLLRQQHRDALVKTAYEAAERQMPLGGVDWRRSSVYTLGRSSWGYLFLLSGSRQSEALVARLVSRLLEIRDPDTDVPIVRRVWAKEDLYSGDRLSYMPDLLVEPTDGYSFTGHRIVTGSVFKAVDINDFHVGNHHADGILVISGEPVVSSDLSPTPQLVDIAPTVLWLLDLPVPDTMEGRILKEVFPEGDGRRTSAMCGPAIDDPGCAYAGADGELVTQRLRNLGYL